MKITVSAELDCSSFTPVRAPDGLKAAEANDGLRRETIFVGPDGAYFEGPTPLMVQRDAIRFLRRENALADARRRGYRWRE